MGGAGLSHAHNRLSTVHSPPRSNMDELSSIMRRSPTAQPVPPDPRAEDNKLKIGRNITYIVAAVVIQDGKVLLTQEAFHRCRGKWYLPAGKMERNETIVEATKREVREETGLEFEPEALFNVEAHHNWQWIRFTFSGHITGGSLRTLDQADSETMQANWWTSDINKLQKEIPLRAADMLTLIDIGKRWYEKKQFAGLPADVAHVSSSLRLVLVDCGQKEGEMSVLMREGAAGSGSALPVAMCGSQFDPIGETLKACGYVGKFKICGVLSAEHFGKQSDGFCLTLLLKAMSKPADGVPSGKGSLFVWTTITDAPLAQSLKDAVFNQFGCARFD